MIAKWIEERPEWALWSIATFIMYGGVFYEFKTKSINVFGITASILVWAASTLFLFYREWKKRKEIKYWEKFHQKYGKAHTPINVPLKMWYDFDAHFYLYDEHGKVKGSAKTEEEAVTKHKETGLYITRIIEMNQ